ncbi:hypothetical protein [Homoserinimonas sp. OAct 916]|uniref:hypothetical protein n=1 Tax=Homoserinimonas sp. OAct 916 TaxID=2211450 RepID=UPI000DBE5743|nr:hypothetical protein [Homoserinimonas sp. OAct 916]
MTNSFALADSLAVSDLRVYLSRAARVEDGSVRLIAGSGVLAVYSAIFYPRGLLDRSDTVLGLRTWAIDIGINFDSVVPIRSLLERLPEVGPGIEISDSPVTVRLPHPVSTVTWSGISPPRGGWVKLEPIAATVLEQAAQAGIAEVAQTVPEAVGEQIVTRVRQEVWGRPIAGAEYLGAGSAFGALSLGFLIQANSVAVFQSGPWTRLTTARGHILVRRQPWTLKA